jgi:hypothetical protein
MQHDTLYKTYKNICKKFITWHLLEFSFVYKGKNRTVRFTFGIHHHAINLKGYLQFFEKSIKIITIWFLFNTPFTSSMSNIIQLCFILFCNTTAYQL